jgi:two-component system cell cycle response regulator DivK
MVVEDFDDTRTMLKSLLEMSGYTVVEAANGRVAVAMVKRKCPDLILMDLNMPELDGLAATEQIRQCRDHCKKVPIVAVSALDTEGIKEAAFEAGCNEYLTKPIDFDELECLVHGMLAGRSSPHVGAVR